MCMELGVIVFSPRPEVGHWPFDIGGTVSLSQLHLGFLFTLFTVTINIGPVKLTKKWEPKKDATELKICLKLSFEEQVSENIIIKQKQQ